MFMVDYDGIAISDILDILKYLMKKNDAQICEANICFNNDVFWL